MTNTNVYIKNLPVDVDESLLQSMFGQFGAIECCRVQRNPSNTTGKTFGFVKYISPESAAASIQRMNGIPINGSSIEVKLADQDPGEKVSSGGTPSDNVYVRNLPNTWNTEEVNNLFAPYGSVLSCRLLHHGDGIRGAGALVRMSSVQEATQAITSLNGKTPQGSNEVLLVRYADSVEEKARRKARKPTPQYSQEIFPLYIFL